MLRLRTVSSGVSAAAFALAVGFASPAMAHDSLTNSQPSAGATITTAPKEVTLTFSGDLVKVGNQVSITQPNGKADMIAPVVSGNRVVAPFKPSGDGKYKVLWRVTSSDGHPISGGFDFTLKGSSNPSTSGAATPSKPTSGATTGGTFAKEAPTASPSTVKGPTTPTRDEPGDNQPLLVIGGAIVAALAIAGGFVVARKRVKDDPR